MTALSSDFGEKDVETLLRPYMLTGATVPPGLYAHLTTYLQLLLKWNARTNLTAIRDPREIVRRHFGESIFAAQHLGECESLLDFGSGAGFPGLPIQLMHPGLRVTLAESQNKKATFLREVVRTLGLRTEIWAGRVEAMPPSLRFDVVTLRAVDNMDTAIAAAVSKVGRQMMLLTTARHAPIELVGFTIEPGIAIPGSEGQQLLRLNPRS